MSGGKGGSTSTSSSSSTQTPPGYLNSAYQQLVQQAQSNAYAPLQQYTGQLVAPFNGTQNEAFGEVAGAQGAANPYLEMATGAAGASQTPIWASTQQYSPQNVQNYYNPYQTDVINSTMANIQETNGEQDAQLQGNAISSGAWGGDRAGIAAAELSNQQGLAAGQTLSQLENQGFSQAQNQLNTQQQLQLGANEANSWLNSQAANIYGNLGNEALNTNLTGAQALLSTGNQQQAQTQANLNVPYEQYLQQQAYPYQTTDYLANILEGIGGVAGGTTTGTSTSTQPEGSVLSSILGGAEGITGILGQTGAFGSSSNGYNGYLTNLFGSSPSGATAPDGLAQSGGSSNGINWGAYNGPYNRGGGIIPRRKYAMGGGGIIPDTVPNVGISFVDVGTPSQARANFPQLPQQQQGGGGGGGGGNPLGAIASMFNRGGVARGRYGFGGVMPFSSMSASRHLSPHVTIGKVPDMLKTPKFDDGGAVGTSGLSGLVPSAQTMNPNAQQAYANISQMPAEKLQELAARTPPNSPQGAMIQRALRQKQMMPNVGSPSQTGVAPQTGGGLQTPQFAKGGRTRLDDGGISPPSLTGMNDLVTDDNGNEVPLSYVGSNKNVPVAAVDKISMSPYPELMNAPQTKQGIAAQQGSGVSPTAHLDSSQKVTADPWEALTTAGFATLAGRSTNPLINIGEGGLAGVKEWNQSKQQAADQTYKNAEVGKAADQLSEEAGFHKQQLSNEAAKIDEEKTRDANTANYQQGMLNWRNNSIGAGKPGAIQNLADSIMYDDDGNVRTNPNTNKPYTQEEALSMAKQTGKAAPDDALKREDLALKAFTAGGFQDLQSARAAYGLPANKPQGGNNTNQTTPSILSAPPPMNARVSGQVYQTPKGAMTWTGSGWLPAGNQ